MLLRILQSTIILGLLSCVALSADQTFDPGPWSTTELEQIIAASRHIDAPGERIVSLSRHFIDTPYVEDTLVGNPDTAEQLVINLAGFDCFTFLDTVEALRRTSEIVHFPEEMKEVRYRGGKVAYTNRRHFFSDWVVGTETMVQDVTQEVGQGSAQVVIKQLNLKSDGTHWLPEIPVVKREITYIPVSRINQDVLSALESGDYVGVYTDRAGLDVSHTGLIVKAENRLMLRHASARNSVKKVVDVDLLEYLQGKPGLVVFRAR
ncbi:MAG: DUF1460 domain-containing protein [Gammaproteobacteria bacterium]|nr:DUF1460 domain-containing protein [Gammaproteobacteria bacterium]